MFELDVHTHTVASGHAYSTLIENINFGKEKGLELLGVSDHAPTLPGGAYIFHFQNMKHIPSEVDGLRVLKGVEANIIDFEGRLDMIDRNLEALDYVIASLHPPCKTPGTVKENTAMIIKAMQNPLVKIIGHPDDGRFPLDYTEVVKAAKATGTLLEVNNSSLNPNGFRLNVQENVVKMLALCATNDVKIICGSDAHIAYDIGRFDFCEAILDEVGFPEDLVINHSTAEFLKWIEA